MKRYAKYSIALYYSALSFLFTACLKDPILLQGDIEEGKGVKVSIYLNTPGRKVVNTKIAQENAIEDVYIFVFDNDDILQEIAQANADDSDQGESSKFMAALSQRKNSGKIYIIANSPKAIEAAKTGWILGTTTLEEFKSDLLKSELDGTKIPKLAPLLAIYSYTGITNSMTIGSGDGVPMTRATAKVTVNNYTQPVNDLVILGANLVNIKMRGYVFPEMDITNISIGEYKGDNGSGTFTVDYPIAAANASDPLYCYETPAANKPYLIVKTIYKGIEGYYRINLTDAAKNQLALERNKHYQVNIKSLSNAGYRTVNEAKTNPAVNGRDITFEINVTDPFSHDIVSNGEQSLGVENSELIVYQKGAINNILATVLNYTVPASGWSPGVISVNGNGLSLYGGNSTLPATNTVNREIRINLSDNFTQGSLTFRIGDMAKVVTIKKFGNILAFEPPVKFENYVIATKGEIQDNPRGSTTQNGFQGKSWVRLSNDDTKNIAEIPDIERLVNQAGQVYLYFAPNFGFNPDPNGTAIPTRSGEVFLSKATDLGRTKIAFLQEGFDVYQNVSEIKPVTYVGTFHRANETGERIIRIPANNEYVGLDNIWRAMVIVGSDWIKLSTNKSLDPGVGIHYHGKGDNPTWKTSTDIESKCDKYLSPKPSTDINGTYSPALWTESIEGNPKNIGEQYGSIYFRVSLTSELPASQNGKPRYGVIAFVHKKGVHFIYVRQGEQDDELMRDGNQMRYGGDTYGNNTQITNSRPFVAKFSPYNLIAAFEDRNTNDPDGNGNMNAYDFGQNGYKFVRYPSQGGYYFFNGSTKAINQKNKSLFKTGPFSGQIHIGTSNSTILSSPALYETCPPGYRRPKDGLNILNSGDVLDSEIRQSLWLYPRNGDPTVTAGKRDNIRRGYYADGFFDRRQITIPNINEDPNKNRPSSNPSMVIGICEENDEIYNMAFSGYLIFNPNDHTSIFFPEPGYYTNLTYSAYATSNTYASRGNLGVYLTSNIKDSGPGSLNLWTLQFGDINNYSVADNYTHQSGHPASVRCVRIK